MTYIKLEDVQKILTEYSRYPINATIEKAKKEINSLPSIDFEEIIKQEIQELKISNRKL